MSNIGSTELDDIAAGLAFIGEQLHENEIEEGGQERMIGAGFILKLLAREVYEKTLQLNDDPNMSQEYVAHEGLKYLNKIK
jgi:hypothetical protein